MRAIFEETKISWFSKLDIMAADMLEKVKKKTYTLEEYFELEEKAVYKSEFQNGKIIPMPGGTINHNRIKIKISTRLSIIVEKEGLDWEVFDSDQKIFLPAINQSVYSDTCVVSGKLETYKSGNQAILNPVLIFEVASDSTSGYDRKGKFRKYNTLPSFREYVLVDQEPPVVDVLYKMEEGDWRMKTYIGLEAVIPLESIGVSLKMADIYKNVPDLKDPQSALEFDPGADSD